MRTFSLLVLAILGFAFVACDDDDHLGDWAKAPEFSGRLRNQAVSFTIGDYAYVGLGFGVDLAEYKDFKKYNLKEGTWSDVPDNFPGKGRHGAVAFVAQKGGKTYAYVGLGYISSMNTTEGNRPKEYLDDFYRFDPETETWEKVADFPGEARRDAVAFTLDNYGYVGTGRADKALLFKDFYCYDPENDSWSGDLGFKGDQKYGASAFVVGGAAYVCLGAKGSGYAYDNIKCTPLGGGKVAWEEMQALTDKPGVKQDKDYGRIPRAFAVSFVSNKGKDADYYAYIATGYGGTAIQTVWKYNHKKDQWHQMEDLAPSAGTVCGAVSFVADGYGYYTTGGVSPDPIDASSSSSVRYISNSTWKFIPDVKETRRNDY